ncbi:ADP-ribose pyrophosphatase YjhB (NUDIX family) [Streptomyces sp. 3211.6]|uniref:phosphotransferase n=1 Tax=Streptomyces sp. 3211.6 TaxID=1938845 RepID=UPI000F128703|nr:phosphotransferase [Streptomyces sp. 3211.6]RKT02948.1 ADP-ribose pyrophosphatase YjhB (NUDIX family) [Streptomyces sp. 3211.6]
MSGGARHTVPVDVHLILRRDGESGPQVLLSRRAGPVYASGLWHLPSGHLDPDEDMVEAVIREALEETGVRIETEDVTAAVTVHHRPPVGSRSRIGVFFEVRHWSRRPRIMEPDRCDGMDWYPLDTLPDPMVAYCRAGLDAYHAGLPAAVHFQQPGDAIEHRSDGPDRTRLLSGPPVGGMELPYGLRVFAEQAVGRIVEATEVSWVRTGSRVWRLTGPGGGTWYLKRHRGEKFHDREVTAYRSWVPALGGRAPRLVAADTPARAVVVTALPGHPLHGMVLGAADEARVQQALGRLVGVLHRSAPERPAAAAMAADKIKRHLDGARPYLADGDEDLVLALARAYADLPKPTLVPTHGDLQYRNVLLDGDGEPLLFDFERSEYNTATRDMVRLCDTWTGRPDLRAAFLDGYGRVLTPAEELRLDCDAAFDAVSGIAYGTSHDDPEVTERGHRTLRRLRTQHP